LQSALVAAITPIAVSKVLVDYTETNVNDGLKDTLTEESRCRLFGGGAPPTTRGQGHAVSTESDPRSAFVSVHTPKSCPSACRST
jgi:hypothetical protein